MRVLRITKVRVECRSQKTIVTRFLAGDAGHQIAAALAALCAPRPATCRLQPRSTSVEHSASATTNTATTIITKSIDFLSNLEVPGGGGVLRISKLPPAQLNYPLQARSPPSILPPYLSRKYPLCFTNVAVPRRSAANALAACAPSLASMAFTRDA